MEAVSTFVFISGGCAAALALVRWVEAPTRRLPTIEPDPLVELEEVHRLELNDWDFAFQAETGKEAFPEPKPQHIVQGYYYKLSGQALMDQQRNLLMQNESERSRRAKLENLIGNALSGGLSRFPFP